MDYRNQKDKISHQYQKYPNIMTNLEVSLLIHILSFCAEKIINILKSKQLDKYHHRAYRIKKLEKKHFDILKPVKCPANQKSSKSKLIDIIQSQKKENGN